VKINVEATTSRCAEGNFDCRVVLAVDTSGGYGNQPVIGAIDHAMDGARKAVVAAIEADRKGLRDVG
jgi:hypothetical protein